AMYLYWLEFPVWVSLGLMLTLAVLTFVPSLYLYTSYRGPFSRLTNCLLVVWTILLVLILANVFANPKPWIWVSAAFPLYYFGLSWWITLRRWLA
ncbi:MAG: CDP-alcohol phosphatidyltransferase, partial [Acidobacteria bacterium]|nr:CDP-alcohol phosphatidyltransferase [Acidobacteriota bacterium]